MYIVLFQGWKIFALGILNEDIGNTGQLGFCRFSRVIYRIRVTRQHNFRSKDLATLSSLLRRVFRSVRGIVHMKYQMSAKASAT